MGAQLRFGLEFMRHYNELNLELAHEYNGSEETLYFLQYNPENGVQVVERPDSLNDP
jgi:hypothetical protein